MSRTPSAFPPSLRRLAPLAAAAALLCAASAGMAQQTLSSVQTSNGVVTGTVNNVLSPNGVQSNTFGTSSTAITTNSLSTTGIGNNSADTLDVNNQPLATPTVSVTQTVNAAVSGTTNTKIGIDTTGATAGNGGPRTNAQGVVSNNTAQSTAKGNTNNARLNVNSNSPLTVGSTASAFTIQDLNAPVTATTSAPALVGINLLPRGGAWNNLALTVQNNQLGADAFGNQSTTGVGINAAGAMTLAAPVTSTVVQTQSGAVGAATTAGTVGIAIQNTLLTSGVLPANSAFTVDGNGVNAAAQGNQLVNTTQVDASTLAQSGTGLVQSTSNQSASAGSSATSLAGFVGVNNTKPVSSGNDYTVSGNTVGADASGNLGTSTAGVGSAAAPVSTITGVTAAVSNTQTFSAGVGVSASATATQLGVSIGGTVLGVPAGVSSNEHQTVSNNAVEANAMGSQGSNQAAQYGATVTGALTSVNNQQTHQQGNVRAAASAPTLGITTVTSSTGGQLTIGGNRVQARADGTQGDNAAAVQAANTLSSTAATVDNNQTHTAGNVSATAGAALLGRSVPLSSGESLTINGNAVNADATGAGVTNAAALTGATLTGGTAAVTNTQSHQSGNVSGSATVGTLGTQGAISNNGSLTISGNALGSSAQGAWAVNEAAARAGNASGGTSATVTSSQTHIAGDATALTTVTRVGSATGLSTGETLVVNGNQLTAQAGSQRADNQATLDAASALTGGGAFVSNFQTHDGGNVSAQVSGAGNAQTLVGAGGSAAGGTVQVSGNAAAANADVNLATNGVTFKSGNSLSSTTPASLRNIQSSSSGTASAVVGVDYGISGIRSLGNSAVVSNNNSQSAASQNQAGNTLTVQAANALSTVTPTLNNDQQSGGSTTATTVTDLLSGVGVANGDNGNTTISGNTSGSTARANVANNALRINAGSQAATLGASLTNTQGNTGGATASTSLQVPVGSAALPLGGAITVVNNAGSSLAAGNAALNSLEGTAGTALNSGSSFALNNGQTNSGAINATTTLNVPVYSSAVTATNVNLLNNAGSATAFGNSATNQVALAAMPSQLVAAASISSTQFNSGNVTAIVDGNVTNTGGGANGAINVSGNRVTAVAVGNSAVSTMTIGVK